MSETAAVWRFDDVRVDCGAAQVWKDGRLVELEPKAFDVLCHLVERQGQLVSKQELFDTVWNGVAVTDNALTRVVAQLRKALGDDSRQARYIETVPTRGYRFIAEVSSPAPATSVPTAAAVAVPDDVAPAAASPPVEQPFGRRATDRVDVSRGTRRWLPIAAAAIAVAVIVTGVLVWRGLRPVSLTGDEAAAAGGRFELAALEQTTYALALDAFPTFSPDGAALAFASNRNGRFEIFARAFASGSAERQVTDDGQQNVQPDWSPDGGMIAYHSLARGGIWIVPATGGTSRQLVEAGSTPRWSPDGRFIAYQSAEIASVDEPAVLAPSVVRVVSVADGVTRDVTRSGEPPAGHGQPVWSPDGRRLVFIANSTREAEIWSADVATGVSVKLAPCAEHCRNPLISPDGAYLYFSTLDPARSLSRVRLAADGAAIAGPIEGTPIAAGPNLQGISMSRDGTRIAFGIYSVRSSLQTVRLTPDARAAGPPEPLTRDTSRRNAWPTFSADGSRLVFTSSRPGQGHQVWTANADGSQARQLTDGRVVNMAPGWISGDREVAFQTKEEEGMTLRAMDLSTRRVRDIMRLGSRSPETTAQFAAPRFMSDGLHLVFGRQEGDRGNIWMMNLQTRAARQISHDPELAGFPVGSRDGRWIAYEAYRGTDMHLAVVPTEGGADRVLTSGRGLTWPNDFSPDTSRILCAYRRDGVWNIGWVPRDGGPLQPITTFTNAAAFVRYPAWSPLNDRIVFEQAELSGNVWVGRVAGPAR